MKHRWHDPYSNNPPRAGDRDTCRSCGKAIVYHGELSNRAGYWRVTPARPKPQAKKPTRQAVVPGCRICALPDRMRPSHDPSPFCESGKRPHCTCDYCF